MTARPEYRSLQQIAAKNEPYPTSLGEGRCPDFDEDCALVPCHLSCWLGGRRVVNGHTLDTPTAKGFCPYTRNL